MTALLRRIGELSANRLALAVGIVAATTVAAGLVQLTLPGVLLGLLDAEVTTTTRHLFAIVGMFMAVIGGAVLQAVFDRADHPFIIFWGGVQKLGAVAGVLVGVLIGAFSALALLIVAFDAVFTVITFVYWRTIK